jgi:hypothetical protein
MGATSGAGYIYPTKYLYDNGYTLGFKSKDDYNALSAADQEKAVIGVDQTSYPNAVKLLMTGQIDAACGFMDIRYGSAYVQDGSDYYHDDSLFTKGYTVGITDPIMNDTLSVNASAFRKRSATPSRRLSRKRSPMAQEPPANCGLSHLSDLLAHRIRRCQRQRLRFRS